jgi:hypothetical protein
MSSLTHDTQALRFLVARVGTACVVIGTDCPFDMVEEDTLARIACLEGLSEAQRDRICGRHALVLLGES